MLGALLVALSLVGMLPAPAVGDENQTSDDQRQIQTIEVLGKTPAREPDAGVERIPENVQRFDSQDLDRLESLSLTDALGRSAGGVHLAQSEDNPFHPDLTYRGFVGSPVLGTSQGISVFQDGVRLNEVLGDTVNWDLVPQDAIGSVEVVPGADARYGRNTLGGAILLETKRGFTHPGTRAEASYGSFGRRRGLIETGGSRGGFDFFALGSFFHEDGFRDFSESRVNQAFGEAGWRDADDDLELTYTLARNNLRGNGFVPESFLERDRASIYTQPDVFRPDLDLVSLRGQRTFSARASVEARFYFRNLDFRQSNGDSAAATSGDEELPGVLRVTRSHQRRFGGTLGGRYASRPFGGENDLSAGLEVDRGDAAFRLSEADGFLNDRRAVVTTGPPRARTEVSSGAEAVGAFLTDSFSPWPWATITPALRYDRQHLSIDDHLGGEASGNHVFARLDPSIGATLRPDPRLDVFARYGESFRAPTAVELTCASEQAPCPLPIAFAADPPLEKVRARSYEVGLRSQAIEKLRLKLACFRTDLDDDILFVSRTRSLGFFRNVGTTRRQGVEAFVDGSVGRVRWFTNYSFTRATFETSETLPSPAGDNPVHPGDVIPGIPDHLLKAGLDAPLLWGLRASADLQYAGRRFLRTDEGNHQRPLGGYVVVNAGLDYTRGVFTLFARAENLFDAEYESFGTQGENVFDGNRVERFLSPGAPIGGWFGVRVDL